MIGKGSTIVLTEEELHKINDFLMMYNISPVMSPCVCVFSRAVFNRNTYYSKERQQFKKRNAYTVAYFTSSSESVLVKYGLVEKFYLIDDHHIALIRELETRNTGPPHDIADTIVTVESQKILFSDYLTYSEGETAFIFVHNILTKCCNLSNNNWNLLTSNVNDKLELM